MPTKFRWDIDLQTPDFHMSSNAECNQNLKLTDEELQEQTHSTPKIELIHTLANPRNEHLSLSLEMLWRACKPGYCNQKDELAARSHRYAISAISHSWFAMEAAVNLTLFNLLKNEDCNYFLKEGNRKTIDRKISGNLNSSYPFDEKLTYLDERMECCNTIKPSIGKIRAFEKLRNALAHGYSIKKNILLEELPDTKKVEESEAGITTTTSYMVGDEEFTDPKGKSTDIMKPYRELGIENDFTNLCRHDAYKCIRISLFILQWIDSHYGIQTYATWNVHNESFRFYTRNQKTAMQNKTNHNLLIGKDSLFEEFNKKDNKEIQIAKSKWKKQNSPHSK